MKSRSTRGCGARLIRVLAAAIVLMSAPVPGLANELAYNPRPAKDDIVLPMPAGYKMAFVRVPIPGTGYWGSSDRVFEMGGGSGQRGVRRDPAPAPARPRRQARRCPS